jgi:hypothetical protein
VFAHVSSHVGQPGQVFCPHWVQQVHCSPNTVPFGFSLAVVSKLSTIRFSSSSLSLGMIVLRLMGMRCCGIGVSGAGTPETGSSERDAAQWLERKAGAGAFSSRPTPAARAVMAARPAARQGYSGTSGPHRRGRHVSGHVTPHVTSHVAAQESPQVSAQVSGQVGHAGQVASSHVLRQVGAQV